MTFDMSGKSKIFSQHFLFLTQVPSACRVDTHTAHTSGANMNFFSFLLLQSPRFFPPPTIKNVLQPTVYGTILPGAMTPTKPSHWPSTGARETQSGGGEGPALKKGEEHSKQAE